MASMWKGNLQVNPHGSTQPPAGPAARFVPSSCGISHGRALLPATLRSTMQWWYKGPWRNSSRCFMVHFQRKRLWKPCWTRSRPRRSWTSRCTISSGEAQRRELQEGHKVQGSFQEHGEKGGCHQGLPATSPSDGSWDPISLDCPGRRQVEDFLTDQEKNDLRNLHGATMSSFIAASSARSVLETIPMLSFRELQHPALHTIQCGWWSQLCDTGRINLLLNIMFKLWLLLILWSTTTLQSAMWSGRNVSKLYLLKRCFRLFLMMLICLTAMTLLYLKLLNIAMVSLKKIDRLGMPNCSTITVQQDTPRTRTWFTCFAMLDFPSGRSKLLEIFDAIACDRLLQRSKSSGEVPRATTHPWCKAWETVGADSSERHVPNQQIKIKFSSCL